LVGGNRHPSRTLSFTPGLNDWEHGAGRLGAMAPSARSSALPFSKLGYFVLDLRQPFSRCQMLLVCRARVFITSFELALQQQIYFRSPFF